jgi:hypothetical protein
MTYRKLRIAWSVGCGIVAVLLCMLWVRSYWRVDAVVYKNLANFVTGVASIRGCVWLQHLQLAPGQQFASGQEPPAGWLFVSRHSGPSIRWSWSQSNTSIGVPIFLLVAVSAALVSAPWLPFKRFSLRTLLIATTLVAVVLGLIVWLR